MREHVVEQIKDALVSGLLRPGQRVSADGLARELQVSHIPVREALNKLEVEGHLTSVPNRGFFVPTLSLAEVEDVYLWRTTLEDQAHRMVVPDFTDADIAKLESLNAQMAKAAKRKNDMVRFHRINREFHFMPFELMHSRRLIRLLDQLWDTASHYQSVLIRITPSIPHLQEQHEDLMKAFKDRDVDAVIAITGEHRETTLSLMREKLNEGEHEALTAADDGEALVGSGGA